jgi:hypothetical protein
MNEDFININVTMVTDDLKPSANKVNQFHITNFARAHKKAKKLYDTKFQTYPRYIIQTGYNFVQPYSRPPKINNNTVIPIRVIKEEPSSQQQQEQSSTFSQPMDIAYEQQANIFCNINLDHDSDCMIIDDE